MSHPSLTDRGRTAEAITLVEQALASYERLLGPDHPRTLAARNNLAITYWAAGRTAEAITLHEQALVAMERVLGPDHPSTRVCRDNLARARRLPLAASPCGSAQRVQLTQTL